MPSSKRSRCRKSIGQLKQRAKDLGVDNLFDFCGGVYGDKKWELFKQADLFVLPTYSENFGIVVAESLSSGTPVITTTGTPWEELNSYKCGWCVEPTQAAITAAIRQAVMTTPETLAEMGTRGRALIEQNYSTDSVAQRMKILYDSVLKNSNYSAPSLFTN